MYERGGVYVAVAHGAKTASAIKAAVEFVQSHPKDNITNMYEDKKGARASLKIPRGSTAANTLTSA